MRFQGYEEVVLGPEVGGIVRCFEVVGGIAVSGDEPQALRGWLRGVCPGQRG